MHQDTYLIENAHLFDPKNNLDCIGGIFIKDGIIEDIGAHVNISSLNNSQIEVFDAKQNYLFPGFVDFRCLIGEPGNEHMGTFETEGYAALCGGITHMALLPNTKPCVDNAAMVEHVHMLASKHNGPNISVWGAMTKNLAGENLAEFGFMNDAGAIGFCDGYRSVAKTGIIKRALQYAKNYHAMIAVNPVEPDLAGGHMNAGSLAVSLGISGQSWHSEAIAIEKLILLQEMCGGNLHINHISTKKSVEIIRQAKARGVNITCDTSPPYFTLNELAVIDYATFAKLSPPLRTEEDRQAIVEAIADGTIDFIASDHIPQDEEAKRLPFEHASFGGVGFESLFCMSLSLYHNNFIPLKELISMLTFKPAQALNIDAGHLSKGSSANFNIADINKAWQFDDKKLNSHSRNTPFGGLMTQGKILHTIVNGKWLYRCD